MRKLRLWPIEPLPIIGPVQGRSFPESKLWLCTTNRRQHCHRHAGLLYRVNHSAALRPVGTKEKLVNVEALDVGHLSKGNIEYLTQIWTEFLVSDEPLAIGVTGEDRVLLRTKPQVLDMAARYPAYLAYTMRQPEFKHILAIRVPIESERLYVVTIPSLYEPYILGMLKLYRCERVVDIPYRK